MTTAALMAALLCILGPVSVPIGPVPLSLGVAVVYLCAYVLGAKAGVVSVVVYLLLGLVGLPVFTGYAGGPAKLFGPTGGYLIGYIPLVLITGLFVRKFALTGIRASAAPDAAGEADVSRRNGLHRVFRLVMQTAGMLLGLAVCYALGTAWFMVISGSDLTRALSLCVIPFLPFDALKTGISLILGNALHAALRQSNLSVY